MNKAEWDAMDPSVKDGLVLNALWKDRFGKPFKLTWHEENGKAMYLEHVSYTGFEPERITRFSINRTYCGIVLEEIERRKLTNIFLDEVRKAQDDLPLSLWAGICLDADTICYCAIKAVEEE